MTENQKIFFSFFSLNLVRNFLWVVEYMPGILLSRFHRPKTYAFKSSIVIDEFYLFLNVWSIIFQMYKSLYNCLLVSPGDWFQDLLQVYQNPCILKSLSWPCGTHICTYKSQPSIYASLAFHKIENIFSIYLLEKKIHDK